jgi:hypothetical protein
MGKREAADVWFFSRVFVEDKWVIPEKAFFSEHT